MITPPPHPLWASVVGALRHTVEPYDIRHWILPIRCSAVNEPTEEAAGEVVLAVPDALHKEWIEENFLTSIVQAVCGVQNARYSVRLTIAIDEVAENVARKRAANAPMGSPTDPSGSSSARANAPASTVIINPMSNAEATADLVPRYVFNTFVEGPTNRFASSAALAVAENPGTRYNPLFLYGGVGLGKTHLLHAIGHHVAATNPTARIRYVTSERFVNDLIDAIRTDKMQWFRARYRDDCDVLLIDDIQFIAGKERTQEEFFHMFNTLHSSHKQIVMTSDTVPQSIPDMEDRLRSRLQWGLIANINPPSFETRVAILKAKADEDGLALPDDVAMLVARHVNSNVRELEGVLMRLSACTQLFGRTISMEMAYEVLGDLVKEELRRVTPENVMRLVAQEFGVSTGDLKGPRRQRSVTVPRQVAMYLLRKLSKDSLPQIGSSFGGRDHSTVLNALRRVDSLKSADPVLADRINSLSRQLTSH